MRALSRTNYNRLKLKALGDWNEFTLALPRRSLTPVRNLRYNAFLVFPVRRPSQLHGSGLCGAWDEKILVGGDFAGVKFPPCRPGLNVA